MSNRLPFKAVRFYEPGFDYVKTTLESLLYFPFEFFIQKFFRKNKG